MSGESRGPSQLAPTRSYPYQSNQDPRTNITQHGGTHYAHPYPPAQTYRDRSPYNPSTGSSARSGRRDNINEAATGNHRPLYSLNVRTGLGYPADRFGEEDPESAYASQPEIWAELRRMSAQMARNFEEAETRHTQDIDRINERLDTITRRLDTIEADGDRTHAKKVASGVPKATSNQHPMLEVSRLQLFLSHM